MLKLAAKEALILIGAAVVVALAVLCGQTRQDRDHSGSGKPRRRAAVTQRKRFF